MTDQNNAAQPVLTDDEIRDIENCAEFSWNIPRAIESAVLSKLRAEGVQAADERESEHIETLQRMRADYNPSDGPMSELKATALDAAIAALASAPVADQKPIQLSDDVLQFLKDGVADATQCEEADVDQEFADQLLLLIHKPLYTEPLADYRAVEWGPLVIAPVAGEAQTEGKYRRMFMAACEALAAINEKLGLDPNDGEPDAILSAIGELMDRANDAAPQASEAVRNQTLEEAAQVCEARITNEQNFAEADGTAQIIAEEIRALKTQADKDGAVCSCPTGDGSLRWPCAVHPDCAKGAGGEPIAWESTTPVYFKFITDSRYRKFSPAVRKWYRPYRCSTCAALSPTQPTEQGERDAY